MLINSLYRNKVAPTIFCGEVLTSRGLLRVRENLFFLAHARQLLGLPGPVQVILLVQICMDPVQGIEAVERLRL